MAKKDSARNNINHNCQHLRIMKTSDGKYICHDCKRELPPTTEFGVF